jgi:nucleotide-binding universal stress UspA family protein
MYQKILIPLDGSETAERVIPYAEEIIARFGGQIILASVSELLHKVAGNFYPAYVSRIAEQVQNQLKEWSPQKETWVHSEILFGKPADEILRYSNELDVDIIAMTSRGSTNSGAWPLGSTAEKILRATNRPVLLVRAPTSGAGLQQKKLIKKILVPLDGSQLSEIALPHASALSQNLNAELILVRAIEPDLQSFGVYESRQPQLTHEEKERLKSGVLSYLENAAVPLKQSGLKVSTRVDFAHPADFITDFAVENSLDLIVMSTHGETGISRWVLGSVTDKVVHTGDTPVLVVRRR